MRLADILQSVKYSPDSLDADLEIGGLTCNSKNVKPGDIFVAVRGYAENGRKYIHDAAAKGAVVIIADDEFDAPKDVKKILVSDTRAALPVIADNFYGHPSQRLKVVGVTGTNGKTTITYIMESIIRAAGEGAGIIGTIGYRLKGRVLPAMNTTPGAIDLQSMLAEISSSGLKYAVMEVSSHSLDQRRVESVLLDVAIFTNITSEHLDYHKTIDEYFNVKAKIFDRLKEKGSAVLNFDDDRVASLKIPPGKNVISYAVNKKAFVTAKDIKLSLNESMFTICTPDNRIGIRTGLVGMHNVSNILAAASAALALGFNLDAVKKGVEAVYSVPGRLEPVCAGQPYTVFVDYAHTEDALYKILNLLKEVARNRIITVFGCGGDRDRTKRPLMGKVACRFSDRVIITSDNPRFEDPGAIISQIEEGVKHGFSNYDIVLDRRRAIEMALNLAQGGDIVLIAGKGHENYQIIKDKMFPFDDRQTAMEILRTRGYEGK